MPRKFNQDAVGHAVGIQRLEKEYKRALKNTRRSKAIYDGFLERIDWCLARLRLEERELLAEERKKKRHVSSNGHSNSGGHATTGAR